MILGLRRDSLRFVVIRFHHDQSLQTPIQSSESIGMSGVGVHPLDSLDSGLNLFSGHAQYPVRLEVKYVGGSRVL